MAVGLQPRTIFYRNAIGNVVGEMEQERMRQYYVELLNAATQFPLPTLEEVKNALTTQKKEKQESVKCGWRAYRATKSKEYEDNKQTS